MAEVKPGGAGGPHGILRDVASWARERTLSVDGYALRRLAYLGARFGPEPLVRYSPTFWGAALALAVPARRAAVRRTLRRVHGPRPRLAEELDVLRTFARYAHCLAETLGAERAPDRARSLAVRGEQVLRAELAKGAGVVLVTAHTGLWDVAARVLAERLEQEVIVVMQREADERAARLHDALRQGVRVVHVVHPLDGVGLLRHLRGGGVVALQIDRVPPGTRSVEVALMGTPFAFPEGPFQLAAVAGASIVPVFTRRCGYFEHEVEFAPPVGVPRRPDRATLAEAAQTVAAALERFIQEHPNDWFHFDDG